MKLLESKKFYTKNIKKLKKQFSLLKNKPKLVVISVGENKSNEVYIRNKERASKEVGINFEHLKFKKSSTQKIVALIKKLNKDKNVTSIIVQLPLSKNIDKRKVLETIDPLKDVDAFTSTNKGLLDTNDAILIPCTPLAVIELLKSFKVQLKGKNIVIVGTSEVVGMPLSKLLINSGSTITMCNKNTINLQEHTKKADVLIVAAGHKNLINKNYVKKNSIVINIGLTKIGNKTYGDVDFDDVKNKVYMITPNIGGVGPLTITNLLTNVLICYKLLGKK